MLKSVYFKLAVSFTVVSIFLYSLLKSAKLPNTYPNGFNRHWVNVNLALLKDTSLKIPFEEICGVTKDNIFFSVPNPKWFIMMDNNLIQHDTIGCGLVISEDLVGINSSIVDSPNIYFFANNLPAILIGGLGNRMIDTLKLTTNVYSRADLMLPNFLIIRALDSTSESQVFQKIDLRTNQVVAQSVIIEDQKIGSGGFDSDGWLKYDTVTKKIYYVEFYRNKFYCLDSNLHLTYVNKTIDTICNNYATLKVTKIEGNDWLMPSAPRIRVNKWCYLYNGLLFNVSNLKADNESSKNFYSNAAIDVYQLDDGHYKGSFHIPQNKKNKLKSFILKNNLLFCLFENHISIFTINLHSLEKL